MLIVIEMRISDYYLSFHHLTSMMQCVVGNILSDLFTIISLRHKIVTTCLFLRTHLHLDFLLQVVVDDSVVVLFLEGNLVVLAIGFAHHEAVDLDSALVLEFLDSVRVSERVERMLTV